LRLAVAHGGKISDEIVFVVIIRDEHDLELLGRSVALIPSTESGGKSATGATPVGAEVEHYNLPKREPMTETDAVTLLHGRGGHLLATERAWCPCVVAE
jgi:hypothetical protein